MSRVRDGLQSLVRPVVRVNVELRPPTAVERWTAVLTATGPAPSVTSARALPPQSLRSLQRLQLLVLVEPQPRLLQVVADHLLEVGQTLPGVDHGGQDVILLAAHDTTGLQPGGLTHWPAARPFKRPRPCQPRDRAEILADFLADSFAD